MITEFRDFVGPAGVLLGVAVGSAITLFVSRQQQQHQRRLEIEKRQLAHLEEIHEQLSRHLTTGKDLGTRGWRAIKSSPLGQTSNVGISRCMTPARLLLPSRED